MSIAVALVRNPIFPSKNARPHEDADDGRGAPNDAGGEIFLNDFEEKAKHFTRIRIFSYSSPFGFRGAVAKRKTERTLWGRNKIFIHCEGPIDY